MAENLKVNAKSKILTFKKKHNLLVDELNGISDIISDLEDGKLPFLVYDDYTRELFKNDYEFARSLEIGTIVKTGDDLIIIADKDESTLSVSGVSLKQLSNFKLYVYSGFNDDGEGPYYDLNKEELTGYIYIHTLRITGSNFDYDVVFYNTREDKYVLSNALNISAYDYFGISRFCKHSNITKYFILAAFYITAGKLYLYGIDENGTTVALNNVNITSLSDTVSSKPIQQIVVEN